MAIRSPDILDLDETICPFCGADSKRRCELRDEMDCCPWEESEDDPSSETIGAGG